MGRNSGSKIMFTDFNDGANNKWTWYCQQHAKYDHHISITTFQNHLEQEHGLTKVS